jgi:tetratricopeptide (TPR) repeat protein
LGLALLLAAPRLVAQDKIVKNDGSTVTGVIQEFSKGNVMINKDGAVFGVPVRDVNKVEMQTPAEVAQAKTLPPADQIKKLAPIVAKFKGMPSDWVTETMADEARAYASLGQDKESLAIYDEMEKLYPNNRFKIQAAAGKAEMALNAKKPDEALKMIAPLIEQANKTISPSDDDARLYATAFLVQGRALEAQGKLSEALEAYLTVVTTLYQNSDAAKKAEELATKLRHSNPNLIVN